ncbi:MAG: Rrf2 family nitric oxide-sensitive transcriptional repressor [Celeribacter sp.]|jgi:Rrf2 family nitric oxide-sensitive transcriptional repressor
MRLTTKTNLAARVLMFCAVHKDKTVRSADIAAACNASGNHLAQVVHQLHVHGYVSTQRGRTGGLKLGRDMKDISIGQLFRIFESNVPFAECFSQETNTCPLTSSCRLRHYIERALEAFYNELDTVTLADLVHGNCGLEAILNLSPPKVHPCQMHQKLPTA